MIGYLLRRLFSISALLVGIAFLFGLPMLISGLTGGPTALLIVGGVFTLIGLGAGAWRGWKVWQEAYAIGYGRRAEAKVVEIPMDMTLTINDRHPRFLRYVFVLPTSGQKIQGEGPYLSKKDEALWSVGDDLQVAYHPEDPRVSVILSVKRP